MELVRRCFYVSSVCDDANGMHAVYRIVRLGSMNAFRTEGSFQQSGIKGAVDRCPRCIDSFVVTVCSDI